MNTISRTSFCDKCASSSRPLVYDLYLLFGGTSGKYIVDQCEGNTSGTLAGYTPHVFTVKKRLKGNLVIEKICGMNGCGVDIWLDEDEVSTFRIKYKSLTEMTVSEWNALVQFKDISYHL